MGAGNSKQGIEQDLPMLQTSQTQASAHDGQSEEVPDAPLLRPSCSRKRRHDSDPEAASSNKRLKTSDSSDSFEQDLLTDAPREASNDHNEHFQVNADTSTQVSVQRIQGGIHHAGPTCHLSLSLELQEHDTHERLEPTRLSAFEDPKKTVDDVFLNNDQLLESAHVQGSPFANGGRQPEIESPRRTGTVSPCASTSELSQQMDSQISQASQAIIEAAAGSQDLENAVQTGWKGAPESRLSRMQREQNRQLLREAIRELHMIKDSDLFLGDSLTQSTTHSTQLPRPHPIPHSADDASEVDFVTELDDPLGAFRTKQRSRIASCERQRGSDAHGPATYVEDLDDDDDDLRMPGSPARKGSVRGHGQRALVGYWKGWDEGVFSRQAMT